MGISFLRDFLKGHIYMCMGEILTEIVVCQASM